MADDEIIRQLQQIAASGGAGGATSPFGTQALQGSQVYLTRPNASKAGQEGAGKSFLGLYGQGSRPYPSTQPDFTKGSVDYQTALGDPTGWDKKKLADFVNTGIQNKISGFDSNMGMPGILNAWQSLVDDSIRMTQYSGSAVTPWDVLKSYSTNKGQFGTIKKDGWVIDAATGEYLSYEGKTTKTSTSKNVDLSSPGQVQALTRQVLQQMLGRGPTDKEMAQYKTSINAYESANPQVTTTTTNYTPDLTTGSLDATGQTSTTTGGVTDADRQGIVSNTVQDSKEYGKFQAATTYWDALMSVIGGIG